MKKMIICMGVFILLSLCRLQCMEALDAQGSFSLPLTELQIWENKSPSEVESVMKRMRDKFLGYKDWLKANNLDPFKHVCDKIIVMFLYYEMARGNHLDSLTGRDFFNFLENLLKPLGESDKYISYLYDNLVRGLSYFVHETRESGYKLFWNY